MKSNRIIIDRFKVKKNDISNTIESLNKVKEKYGDVEILFELNEWNTEVQEIQIWTFDNPECKTKWAIIARID